MTPDLHHLAAAYALDALDADERAAFEAHYPTCEICSAEVVDYRATAAELAVGHVAPSAELRDRVLAEISQTRQLPPRVSDNVVSLDARRRRTSAIVVAVAAALVLIAGVVGFGLGNRGSSSTADDIVALLAQPDVAVRMLEGDAVQGSVSVAWSDANGMLAVLGSELADPGNGLVYALWLLDDAGATPSLLFSPDDGAVRTIGMLPGDPSGWGVTIEPQGGSPQPTGDILFVAEI